MNSRKYRLGNGSNLTIVNMAGSSSSTFLVMVRAGPRFDPGDKIGLSHFVEHLMLDGSKNLPDKNMVYDVLEKEGAILGAFSYQETSSFWIKAKNNSMATIIRVLTEQLQNPLFRDEDIRTEKEIVKEEERILKSNPASHIWEVWAENVWQGSCLGRNYIGSEKSIDNFCSSDVRDFFNKNYLVANTKFVLVGDAVGEEVLKVLSDSINNYDRKGQRTTEPFILARKEPINIYYQKTDGITVAYGFLASGISDDDTIVLELMENILGGGWGSLLRRNIFQLGLTYSIESCGRYLSDTGYLMNLFTCEKNKLNKILRLINSQLEIIKGGKIGRADIDRARGYMVGGMVLNNEKSDDLANWFAYQEIFNIKKVLTPAEKCEEVLQVTKEDVVRVAKKYFTENNWYLSIVGPVKEKNIRVIFS